MQRIVIWDSQREYAARLADYLNRHKAGAWLVVRVEDMAEWSALLDRQAADLLLLAEQVAAEEETRRAAEEAGVPVVYLREHKTHGEEAVCRYAGAHKIQSALERRLVAACPEIAAEPEVTALLPVLDSVDSRRQFRRYACGRDAFYWELTAYSDETEGDDGAGEILFAIKGRDEERLPGLVEQLPRTAHASVLSGVDGVWDYRELDREDFLWFFVQLKRLGYSAIYVYIDIGAVRDSSIYSCFSRFVLGQEPSAQYRPREEAQCRMLEFFGVSKERIERRCLSEAERREENADGEPGGLD